MSPFSASQSCCCWRSREPRARGSCRTTSPPTRRPRTTTPTGSAGPRETGVDSNGNTDNTFYVCYSTSQNGQLVEMHQHTNGPGAVGCTGNLVGQSGTLGMYPFAGTATTLAEGSNYTTCASRVVRNVFIWSASSSVCSGSVIDRSPPDHHGVRERIGHVHEEPAAPVPDPLRGLDLATLARELHLHQRREPLHADELRPGL